MTSTAIHNSRIISGARLPGGRWLGATLLEWGVELPPPKHWRRRLLAGPRLVELEVPAEPARAAQKAGGATP